MSKTKAHLRVNEVEQDGHIGIMIEMNGNIEDIAFIMIAALKGHPGMRTIIEGALSLVDAPETDKLDIRRVILSKEASIPTVVPEPEKAEPGRNYIQIRETEKDTLRLQSYGSPHRIAELLLAAMIKFDWFKNAVLHAVGAWVQSTGHGSMKVTASKIPFEGDGSPVMIHFENGN